MRPRRVVLLVEADELRRSLWTFVLDNWGYAVISAPTASEALRLVRDDWSYDVLMCDYTAPEMSGDELARRVKEIRPELRVMVFSELVDKRRFEKGYAEVYLMRGFERSDVMKAMKLLCARKRGPKKALAGVPVEKRFRRAL